MPVSITCISGTSGKYKFWSGYHQNIALSKFDKLEVDISCLGTEKGKDTIQMRISAFDFIYLNDWGEPTKYGTKYTLNKEIEYVVDIS